MFDNLSDKANYLLFAKQANPEINNSKPLDSKALLPIGSQRFISSDTAGYLESSKQRLIQAGALYKIVGLFMPIVAGASLYQAAENAMASNPEKTAENMLNGALFAALAYTLLKGTHKVQSFLQEVIVTHDIYPRGRDNENFNPAVQK
jgi:hypothetical protein